MFPNDICKGGFFMVGIRKIVIGSLIIFLLSFYPNGADAKMKFWNTAGGYKIYQILEGSSNSFVVEFDKNFIMIDTGSKDKWHELQVKLNSIGANQDNFKALILTHSHYDHVENAFKIKDKYGTKIIINKLESEYLENGRSSKIGFPNMKDSASKESIEKFITGLFKYEPVKSDILTEDAYELNELGFKNCRIIKTDGHTTGSECIVIDNEIVITGDAIVNISDNTLPWYFVSKEDLLRSWKKILDTGSRLYLPAHGVAVKREILIKNYMKLISK
jgi:glyoxylase-like metal-dependent hydrolase (beta-lactamase superfamily II)